MSWSLIALLLLIYYLFRRWLGARLPGIPGPWGIPVFGYSLFVGRQMNKTFQKLAETYGPVYQVQLGNQYVVIVCGQKAIREATTGAKGSEFAARPDFKSYEAFGKFGEAGYDAYHKTYKKLTLRAMELFGKHRKTDLQEVAHEALEILMKDLLGKEGIPYDPNRILNLCVWRIMGFICYGPNFELDDPEVSEIQRLSPAFGKAIGFGVLYDFLPWMKRFTGDWPNEYRRLMDLIDNHSKMLAAKNFKTWDGESMRTVADMFAKAGKDLKEDEKLSITDEDLQEMLTSLFGAGFATVASSVRWSLFWMAKYPHVQNELQEELDSILSKNELPTFDDQIRLPFCTAVTAESYRISSMSAMGIAHAATHDATLFDYKIPQGTPVMFNLYSAHYDPEVFPNPNKFDPYRFIDPNTRELNSNMLEMVMPYGKGLRSCGGEHVAKMEIFLFFTSIMHKYQVEGAPGEALDPDDYMCTLGISLNPFNLCFKRRFSD